MKSLGTKLREERERQGRSLEEISTQTKIRQTYLDAIEKDSLDTMPGGFFSRSFVRQYANALGMQGDDVENFLGAVTVAPTDTVRVDKIFAEYRPSSTASRGPSILPSEEDEFEPDFRHEAAFLKDSRSGASWVLFAIVLIAGSGAYLAWQQKPDLFANVLAKTMPIPSRTQAPAAAPTAPPATAPVAANPEIVTVPPTPVAPLASSAPVEVDVVASEQTWVRFIVDGEKIFGGVMEAGEKRKLSGQESAVVFSGNAGGLELTHNGKPIGSVGTKGQVRTIVFSAQNWEIRNQQPKKIEEMSTPLPEPAVVREP